LTFTPTRSVANGEISMSWFIHHINVTSHDLPKSTAFYRDILGLGQTFPEFGTGGLNKTTSSDYVSTIGTGEGFDGLHLTKPIPEFARDNKLSINPVVCGHMALCVPDIEAVRKRLDAAGIMYAYAGEYSMRGFLQLYVYDPSMNVVEINQKIK
jgi:catechol 2,3-dioxygenase-like lactoylglutathione lyase family enzyme